MTFKTTKTIRLYLSTFLILSALTGFSSQSIKDSTTTLALVYHEFASVLNCRLQEPILSQIPKINQVTIEVLSTELDQKIATYSQCQGITEVYAVKDFTISMIPVDPFYASGKQWNLSDIDLQEAWDITTGSPEVIVAVIDTGVSTNSPYTDFGSDGVLLGASIINGITLEDTTVSQYSYDGGSHGTAVASLISANMNSDGLTGIAPDVKILPLKVFKDAAYKGEQVSALGTDIASAILWATDHGADIINMSIGGSADSATQSAIAYAYDHGVILVAASGNNANNSAEIYVDVSYPAAYPEVIAVGSLTPSRTVSNFTNVAGTGLDLSAYGESIYLPWVAYDNYYYLSGTSFSSPTVAGILALMISVNPDLTPDEAKAILLSGVVDITENIYSPGWDVWSGYGMVNALNALNQAIDYADYHDVNTDFASAEFIYGHHAYSNQLRPALDQDYFRFTLYETDDVTITLSTESIQDLMFTVYNENQSVLISVDDNSSAETETVTLSQLAPGSYLVYVTDFAGRGYLSDYQIEVDYASSIPPLISAMTSEGALADGQGTLLEVQLTIIESLYHSVTVTKDDIEIPFPQNALFSDYGSYVVTVDDVLNDPVTFSFSIIPPLVYQPHLIAQVNGSGATLTLSVNGIIIPNESDVEQGTVITIQIDLQPRYRLYQWNVNGVIQTSILPETITVTYSAKTIVVECGLMGDLNLNDAVSTTDLVVLRRYLAGLDPLSSKGLFNADINLDGALSTTDLVQLRRFLAGLE